MASNGQGEGGIDSSIKRGRKNGGKSKESKVRQRGMGVAQLELLRMQDEMAAAAAAGGTVVPSYYIPVYSIPSFSQLHEGKRVHEGPHNYLPPSFSNTPVAAPFLAGPQGVEENLSFKKPDDSSSPSLWHTSDPAPSLTPQSTKMSMGSDGCDLQLGLNTSNENEEEGYDDLEFRPPNYFTNLLLGEGEDQDEYEDAEWKTGHKNKKTRTDSSGEEKAAAGSSRSQELNLELRLSL